MNALKAKTNTKSDRRIAEELLGQYAEYNQTAKECAVEKKAIEMSLLELAEKNPDWFEGKTAHFEKGKLKWVAKSKVELPAGFDMAKFKRKFPNLVKVSESVQLSKARAHEGEQGYDAFGIEIVTKDVFSVVEN